MERHVSGFRYMLYVKRSRGDAWVRLRGTQRNCRRAASGTKPNAKKAGCMSSGEKWMLRMTLLLLFIFFLVAIVAPHVPSIASDSGP